MFDFDGPISDVDHRLVNIDPYCPIIQIAFINPTDL